MTSGFFVFVLVGGKGSVVSGLMEAGCFRYGDELEFMFSYS